MKSSKQTSSALRDALDADELNLRFEPVVRGCNLEILGLEGRPVWRREGGPEYGPDAIAELAMPIGLMPEIGLWTVRNAARQIIEWERDGLVHDLVVHIRFSSAELADPRFADGVTDELEAAGLRPSQLYVEVSLPDLNAAGKPAERTLSQLQRLGCRLVLAGFGHGTPLDAMVRHEFEAVKIERELLQETDESESLLRGVLQIARVLGVTPLVTGLDAQEDLEQAAQRGLAFVQGAALGIGEGSALAPRLSH